MLAIIKLFVVLQSTQLLIKVASSEWVLGVQIINFTNLLNVEIRDQKYCCCDNAAVCLSNIIESSSTLPQNCSTKCDVTYFVVNLLDDVNYTDHTPLDTLIFDETDITEFGSMVFQVTFGSATMEQRGLEIQAWDVDEDDDRTGDDLMDRIIIPNMDTTNDFQLSKLQAVQGEHGIGNFTLIFYNLTHDPNPCDSSSTPISMYYSSSTASQGCITTEVISSSSNILSSDMNTQTRAETMTIVVALLAAVSAILVITSIALGATLYFSRKHKKSVLTSKLTKSKELSTMTAASSDYVGNPTYDPANPTSHKDEVVFDHVYSAVNKKGKVSEKGSQNIRKAGPSMSAAGSTRVMDNQSAAMYHDIVDDEAGHVYSNMNNRGMFAKSSSHRQQDHSINDEVVAIYDLAGTEEF